MTDGTDDVPSLALGRRPPSAKPTLRAARFLTAAVELPQVPDSVNYLAAASYELYQNDRYGVCGPASLAHYVRLVTRLLTGAQRNLTQADIFALYRRQNPAFDPRTGVDDNGVDMKTMLADAVKHGFGPQKVLGFAEVDAGDIDECRAAVAVFGGILLGLDLTRANEQALRNRPAVWDAAPGSPSWGGHAVMEGAYSIPGQWEDCITWMQRIRMTPAFLARQRVEAYVVILPEHLSSRQFIEGWDFARFVSAYESITDRPFPADFRPPDVPAGPVAPPPAQSPEDVLAAAVKPWVGRSHRWESRAARDAAAALKVWLQETGRA